MLSLRRRTGNGALRRSNTTAWRAAQAQPRQTSREQQGGNSPTGETGRSVHTGPMQGQGQVPAVSSTFSEPASIHFAGDPTALDVLETKLSALCTKDGVLRDLAENFVIKKGQDCQAAPSHLHCVKLIFGKQSVAEIPGQRHLFDSGHFQSCLRRGNEVLYGLTKPFGNVFAFAPVITSTQTILEKNARLLGSLPHGTVLIASQQVSGRGRGTNAWLSPEGSLPHSVVVHLSEDLSSRLVFIQYLYGLAVVEAIVTGLAGQLAGQDPTSASFQLWSELDVRLKWPNDIYGLDPEADVSMKEGLARYSKIGGILVNSQFINGQFVNIVGCGLNTDTASPLLSINAIIKAYNLCRGPGQTLPQLSREVLLAAILTKFGKMWSRFIEKDGDGFASFHTVYKTRWLHQNQIVQVAKDAKMPTQTGQVTDHEMISAKIQGLTLDYGFLQAHRVYLDADGHELPLSVNTRQEEIELQPDGNSFDMLAGLVQRKK